MNRDRTTHDSRPTTHVCVVAAVIQRDDCFLVTRRQKGAHLEGCWEFPGGKVEAGETHTDALIREIREELDAAVDVQDLFYSTTHAYPDRTVTLFFYRCGLTGEPRPILGQEMQWIPRACMAALTFPPADEELITRLTGTAGR